MLNKILNLTTRQKLLLLTLSAGAIVIGWCVFFLATHGRIVVEGPAGVELKSMSYCELECHTYTETQGGSLLVGSGHYSVELVSSTNASYTTNITVGRFLSATTVTPTFTNYSLSAVGANVQRYILPVNNGYFTYDYDSGSYMINGTLGVADGVFSAVGYVAPHKLLLIQSNKGTSPEVVLPKLVYLYDTQTRTVSILGDAGTFPISSQNLSYGPNALYALTANGSGAAILKLSSSGIQKIQLPTASVEPNSIETSTFAMSEERLALISNSDEPVISVYSLNDFSIIQRIHLDKYDTVSSLSFSPDNKLLTVFITEKPSLVYSLESGENILQLLPGDSAHWVTNTSFIYHRDTSRTTEDVGSLYLVDCSAKEAHSIINGNFLQIEDITTVIDNKVYFTAIHTGSNGETGGGEGVGGYVLDMNANANTASITDDSLLRKLPYDGLTYSITYHFDEDSHLILDVSAESGSRNSAIEKIAELGFDPGDYTIQFRGYTNPFGNEGETP